MDARLASGLEPLWRLHTVLGLVFAIACGVFGVWHECRWRERLKGWKRTRGRIVDEHWEKDAECAKPEIEFDYAGETRRFVSKYGRESIEVGAQTEIFYHPLTGEAEEFSQMNRWFFTIVPLVIFVAGIMVTIWEVSKG